jgi:hypothetical protein
MRYLGDSGDSAETAGDSVGDVEEGAGLLVHRGASI